MLAAVRNLAGSSKSAPPTPLPVKQGSAPPFAARRPSDLVTFRPEQPGAVYPELKTNARPDSSVFQN